MTVYPEGTYKVGKPNIEWAEISWNPTSGCPGPGGVRCKGCYAYHRSLRLRGRFGYPRQNPFQVVRHPDKVDVPKKRKKPAIYFTYSMGDWLAPGVKQEWRAQDLQTMDECGRHIFVTLTKFYENLFKLKYEAPNQTIPLNVIIGISVTRKDQVWGLDELRIVPAFMHLACFEPLMEDVSDSVDLRGIGWVIIGARTRQGNVRAFQPEWEWVTKLIAKARVRGIPVFLKPNLNYLGKRSLPGMAQRNIMNPIQETPYEKIYKVMNVKGVPAQQKLEGAKLICQAS